MVDVQWQAWNDNRLEHCVVEVNEGGMMCFGEAFDPTIGAQQ